MSLHGAERATEALRKALGGIPVLTRQQRQPLQVTHRPTVSAPGGRTAGEGGGSGRTSGVQAKVRGLGSG